MKKVASVLILTVILVAGMVLPSFAVSGMPDLILPYYIVLQNQWGHLYCVQTSQPLYEEIQTDGKYYRSNGVVSYKLMYRISTIWYQGAQSDMVVSYWMGGPSTIIEGNYSVGSYVYTPPQSVTYLWGVDSGFNCENSYAQFRSFALDLTVNTQGYQDGELSFKQYVQRQTSNGWITLNVESPVSIQANLGIGKSNKIPLWSIIPYQAGTYRYIVNAYKNGVIVPGGSTSKTFDVQTAPTWVDVTTRTAITMGGDTFTPQDQRQVEILSPDDDSTWTDEVLARVGVYGVVNGHIHSEGYDETSIVLWSINPDDPADYQSYFYQLNGIQGDAYFVNKMPLPAGYGECFVYVTGGSSSDVETSYYQIEEDGKWWHVIDIVKIYTEPSVVSGRGSDYWWDKDSGNYIDDPFDLDKIVDSVTNFVGGFAGFFTIIQASMTFIPASILGLGVFGATMSLILVLFRRA